MRARRRDGAWRVVAALGAPGLRILSASIAWKATARAWFHLVGVNG